MSQYHPYRASIRPVMDGEPRPLWSVMIPTYNCASYLSETLASVLMQDPGPEQMQIEVIDDHSTEDDPAQVVQDIGRGRVNFYRQPKNVGHIRNFESCLQRSRGHLIHLLHGDDLVCKGFYSKMQAAFAAKPAIGAAFCRQLFVDAYGREVAMSALEQVEGGILCNWLEHLALEQRIMTPSIVVRRDVYEQLGGFDSRLVCSEDWEMWVRIAACYPIWYETEPLAVYRMHTSSNTGRHTRSGEDIRYTRLAIELFHSYLPEERANAIAKRAKEVYAISALDSAYRLSQQREWVAVRAQLREALACSHSVKILRHMGRLVLKGIADGLWPMNERVGSRP